MAACTGMINFIRENEDVRYPLTHQKNEWIIEKAKKIYLDWENARKGGAGNNKDLFIDSSKAEMLKSAENELNYKLEKYLDDLEAKGALTPYAGLKRVVIYDAVTENFEFFENRTEAGKAVGVDKDGISRLVRKKSLCKSRYRAFYVNRGQGEVNKKAIAVNKKIIKEKVITYVKEKVEVGPYLARKNVRALVKFDVKTEKISIFDSYKNAAIEAESKPSTLHYALISEKILGGAMYYYLDRVA